MNKIILVCWIHELGILKMFRTNCMLYINAEMSMPQDLITLYLLPISYTCNKFIVFIMFSMYMYIIIEIGR